MKISMISSLTGNTNTTIKKINGIEVVFVEVPEDDNEFSNINNIGNYSIIGKASDLSEEQWAGIVESCVIIGFDFFYNGFVDYTKTQAGYFKTTQSGLSLLSSLGMKPVTTLILIKEK